MATVASFANGDGLCFINDERELEGFRVNKVEGNRLFPFRMPENLRPGMALYRNNDQAFEQILARKTAERRIPLFIELQPVLEKDEDNGEVVDGFLATANIFKSVEQGLYYKAAEVFTPMQLQCAKRSQHDNMIAQMSKFGESKYECKHVVLKNDIDAAFIPNSVLSNVRRELIQKLDQRITDELNRSLIYGMDRNFFANPYRLDQPGECEAKSQKELTLSNRNMENGYILIILLMMLRLISTRSMDLRISNLHSNWVLTNARMNRSSCSAAIASAIP